MKQITNGITLLFAVLGFALASYLTIDHFLPQSSVPCGTVGDCHGVLASSYGSLGPIPTAAFGVAMYGMIIFLCISRRKRLMQLQKATVEAAKFYSAAQAEANTGLDSAPGSETSFGQTVAEPTGSTAGIAAVTSLRRELHWENGFIFLIALLGVIISYYLQYIALYSLKSFCPWCFGSASLVTLIFLVSGWDFLFGADPLQGEQKMLAAILAFVGIMGAIIVVPAVLDQYKTILRPDFAPVPVQIDRGRILRSTALAPPNSTAPPADPIKGDPKAPYNLVEFADYMCPACEHSIVEIDKILKVHPDINFRFRNFPLIHNHRWSHEAAQAAFAAQNQGKFWEMHDELFRHQKQMEEPNFSPDQFVEIAKTVGLNIDQFQKDYADKNTVARVDQDMDDATAGGTNTTPTFFFVPPKGKIWRFSGIDDLKKAMADKNHSMWKQP